MINIKDKSTNFKFQRRKVLLNNFFSEKLLAIFRIQFKSRMILIVHFTHFNSFTRYQILSLNDSFWTNQHEKVKKIGKNIGQVENIKVLKPNLSSTFIKQLLF